jgi:hypothetical protein
VTKPVFIVIANDSGFTNPSISTSSLSACCTMAGAKPPSLPKSIPAACVSIVISCPFPLASFIYKNKKPAERLRISGPDICFVSLNLYPHTSTDTPFAW